jgi:hypothetical protein
MHKEAKMVDQTMRSFGKLPIRRLRILEGSGSASNVPGNLQTNTSFYPRAQMAGWRLGYSSNHASESLLTY